MVKFFSGTKVYPQPPSIIERFKALDNFRELPRLF
jgi:hypothetical protein